MNQGLAIVIVSYNCRDALRRCLLNLPPVRTVVVDNASVDTIRLESPTAELITNQTNRGFAAACNQGIRATTEPFVLLLNPDTQVSGQALQTLVRVMTNDPKIGACGPRILNEDSSLQASWRAFPTLGALVIDELGIGHLLDKLGWRIGYRLSGQQGDDARDVDQLGGSCLLLRRAALDQVGLLDERFFVYFEEVDLCLRLKQARWRVVYVTGADITHTGGQSSKSDSAASLGYRYRSLVAYFRKHKPKWQLPVLKLFVQIGASLRVMVGQRHYAAIAGNIWTM